MVRNIDFQTTYLAYRLRHCRLKLEKILRVGLVPPLDMICGRLLRTFFVRLGAELEAEPGVL